MPKEKKDEPGFMYSDMSESDFIRWNLDYTMPILIGLVAKIPDEELWEIPSPHVDPAAWVFGSQSVLENQIVSDLSQEESRIPDRLAPLGLSPWKSADDFSEQLETLRANGVRGEELISWWYDVRTRTHQYLHSLDDSELKRPLGSDEPGCTGDPLRERFVQLVWTQNAAPRKLITIAQLLEGAANRVEFPDWMETGRTWEKEMRRREDRDPRR
jgi:hypothetical protein